MNPFLTDFLRRSTIIDVQPNPEPVQRDHKGRKKSKHGTASGAAPFGEEAGFERLCSEKPHRKIVLEYFRNRINELVAAEEYK